MKLLQRFKIVHQQASKAPFLFILAVYFIYFYAPIGPSVFWWLQKEDGLLENLSAILLLLSSFIFMSCLIFDLNRDKIEKITYLSLSLIFFLWAGEEISWGQRLFDYEVGFLVSNNAQAEVTLHNLNFLQPFLHIANTLLFSTISFLSVRSSLIIDSSFLLPRTTLFYYFALPSLFYLMGSILIALDDPSVIAPLDNQEIYEFLFSLGCFKYAYYVYREVTFKS